MPKFILYSQFSSVTLGILLYITSLVSSFFSLIQFIICYLFNWFKSLLNLKIALDTKLISHCLVIYLGYIVISKISNMDLSTQIEIYILIISSLFLICLIYFDTFFRKTYPKMHMFSLVLFGVIVLVCVIALIAKFTIGFDLVQWLFSSWGFLKEYWVKIKKTKLQETESKQNPGGSNDNKPNNKSDSNLTPEERKKRKSEAQARYRAKNKEKIKKQDKKYRDANKDKVNAGIKKWQEDNPDRHKEHSKKASKKWYKNNPEKANEKSAKWRAANPDQVKINNDISGSKRKLITEVNRADMAQYEGILDSNKSMFDGWSLLSNDELQDLFKKKRIRKDLQRGFEFYKNNPNYYDDLDMG